MTRVYTQKGFGVPVPVFLSRAAPDLRHPLTHPHVYQPGGRPVKLDYVINASLVFDGAYIVAQAPTALTLADHVGMILANDVQRVVEFVDPLAGAFHFDWTQDACDSTVERPWSCSLVMRRYVSYGTRDVYCVRNSVGEPVVEHVFVHHVLLLDAKHGAAERAHAITDLLEDVGVMAPTPVLCLCMHGLNYSALFATLHYCATNATQLRQFRASPASRRQIVNTLLERVRCHERLHFICHQYVLRLLFRCVELLAAKYGFDNHATNDDVPAVTSKADATETTTTLPTCPSCFNVW